MDTVTWTKKGEAYPVYTPEEAAAARIEFRPWRDVLTPREWGLTDDGYVTQLLACWSYTNKKGQITHLKKFTIGRVWQNRMSKLLWGKQKEKAEKLTAPHGWTHREIRRKRVKRAVKVYASFLVAGKDTDWDAVGRAYRPDEKIREATAKRLFKDPKVRAMVDKEVVEILTGLGLNQEFVLKNMKLVVEKSFEKDDLTNARLQLQDLGKILEIFPKDTPRGYDPSRMLPLVDEYREITGYTATDEDAKMLEAAKRSEDAVTKPPDAAPTPPPPDPDMSDQGI